MRTAQTDSPTKEKLLDAAERIMLSKGYAATTIDDICASAGLTKGSFFHYFESKEALGKAVLERYCLSRLRKTQEAGFHKKSDPLQRVMGYIDFAIDASQDPAHKGCLLGNFAQELSETHPEIRAICKERFGTWAEGFKKDLNEAKRRRVPKASFDAESLGEYFIAVLEGSLILAKVQRRSGVVEKNLLHFKEYLKSLFEK